MGVTASRVRTIRNVREIMTMEIEAMNENNVYDQAPEWLDAHKEPPVECQECEYYQEIWNEVTPEATEYLGTMCVKGGCDN